MNHGFSFGTQRFEEPVSKTRSASTVHSGQRSLLPSFCCKPPDERALGSSATVRSPLVLLRRYSQATWTHVRWVGGRCCCWATLQA